MNHYSIIDDHPFNESSSWLNYPSLAHHLMLQWWVTSWLMFTLDDQRDRWWPMPACPPGGLVHHGLRHRVAPGWPWESSTPNAGYQWWPMTTVNLFAGSTSPLSASTLEKINRTVRIIASIINHLLTINYPVMQEINMAGVHEPQTTMVSVN